MDSNSRTNRRTLKQHPKNKSTTNIGESLKIDKDLKEHRPKNISEVEKKIGQSSVLDESRCNMRNRKNQSLNSSPLNFDHLEHLYYHDKVFQKKVERFLEQEMVAGKEIKRNDSKKASEIILESTKLKDKGHKSKSSEKLRKCLSFDSKKVKDIESAYQRSRNCSKDFEKCKIDNKRENFVTLRIPNFVCKEAVKVISDGLVKKNMSRKKFSVDMSGVNQWKKKRSTVKSLKTLSEISKTIQKPNQLLSKKQPRNSIQIPKFQKNQTTNFGSKKVKFDDQNKYFPFISHTVESDKEESQDSSVKIDHSYTENWVDILRDVEKPQSPSDFVQKFELNLKSLKEIRYNPVRDSTTEFSLDLTGGIFSPKATDDNSKRNIREIF